MNIKPPALTHPHVNEAWLAKLREDVLDPDLPIIDAHHHRWEREFCVQVPTRLQADLDAGLRWSPKTGQVVKGESSP